ncbi:hypothetical protein HYY69_03605 [Candidatus Woesearchaeota archaeon]|nr:hypothetical protein [Candidatus Woesearchaeota archaeon]
MNILKKPTTWDDTDLMQFWLSAFLVGMIIGSIIFYIAKPLMIFSLLIVIALSIKPLITYSKGEWLPRKQKQPQPNNQLNKQSISSSSQNAQIKKKFFAFPFKKKQEEKPDTRPGSVDMFLSDEQSNSQPAQPPPPV